MKKKPHVLVVHCVDTEGPIGGNVRRRPDGSAEFLDTWPAINVSIRRLTSAAFRRNSADSLGQPYRYNWFIMDFTGFKTNPKNRIAKYNDTYDHFKKLPTKPDAFYWHYHHPPVSGQGDQWSNSWASSDEYKNILLHRLVEREDFPEAFRAGGTIEDNAASHWLEKNVLIDYSNRVSAASYPTKDIFDFNWHGAPDQWGFYHPSRQNFLQPGKMRRFIVRSIDLWSRLHVVTVDEVRQAFAAAAQGDQPVILSYFSHDHRDMVDETSYVIALVRQVSKETGVAWRSCHALEAVQVAATIRPRYVKTQTKHHQQKITFKTTQPIYQPLPWVGAKLKNGQLTWLPVTKSNAYTYEISVTKPVRKIVIGGTSASGNKFIHVL